METSWPKEQPYSQKHKVSLLNRKSEYSCFRWKLFFIASFDHLCVKIIPLDHFYANIDGMTLDLEYWQEKISFITDFLKWLENEEKTMICSIFKFSVLKHFWSLKLIDRVDFRVLLIFYSFQVIWVDLDDKFEKWTKYSQKLINTEISKHLIWWYFCLFFLMIDWNWLPPPQTPPSPLTP